MKKNPILVSAILGMALMLPFQSCIGSFALTHKVLKWNNQVGSKFINELVFFAFWVLPVYEVTSIADIIVLNTIEFWSGNNPVTASVKEVPTDHGVYYIACDKNGYDIKAPNGKQFRLDFEQENSTWSVKTTDGEAYPFMTMVDSKHLKLITPSGDFMTVEISEAGLLTYTEAIQSYYLALK